jgi:hypothetical protein
LARTDDGIRAHVAEMEFDAFREVRRRPRVVHGVVGEGLGDGFASGLGFVGERNLDALNQDVSVGAAEAGFTFVLFGVVGVLGADVLEVLEAAHDHFAAGGGAVVLKHGEQRLEEEIELGVGEAGFSAKAGEGASGFRRRPKRRRIWRAGFQRCWSVRHEGRIETRRGISRDRAVVPRVSLRRLRRKGRRIARRTWRRSASAPSAAAIFRTPQGGDCLRRLRQCGRSRSCARSDGFARNSSGGGRTLLDPPSDFPI